jgi:hypothetical protein
MTDTWLLYKVLKNPVRTAKKTQLFTITKINRLTVFKEIIAVFSEKHTKPTHNTLWIKYRVAECERRWYTELLWCFKELWRKGLHHGVSNHHVERTYGGNGRKDARILDLRTKLQ